MLKTSGLRVATRALSPTSGFLHFTHTLNPYVGCQYGCRFCYVRGLTPHRVRTNQTGEDWGTYVEAKVNAPELLRKEMRSLRRRGKPVSIFLSSATDPYQGTEALFNVTRQCLEVLADEPADAIVLQTRSPLVARDIELFQRVPNLLVSITIETDDDDIRRRFAPRAPRLAKRHAAISAVKAAGVPTQVAAAPMLPCEPQRFVDWILETNADRYVVDTFTSGEGNYCRRSIAFGVPEILAEAGYPDWWGNEKGREVHALLIERAGHDRVFWSSEGFNQPTAGQGEAAACDAAFSETTPTAG